MIRILRILGFLALICASLAIHGLASVRPISDAHRSAALELFDGLYARNSDILTRKKYVRLVESVKDSGGTVHVFSSMHVSGERIAAVLGFPLPELEDIGM